MIRFLFSLFCMISPTIVTGIPFNSQLNEFDEFKEVRFVLMDTVSGSCWTNLKEVREYTEEKIKMSGMTLNDDGTHQYSFVISSIGGRTNGLCGGQITVGLYTTIPLFDDLKGLLTIKELGLTINDRTFNSRIIDLVGEFFK